MPEELEPIHAKNAFELQNILRERGAKTMNKGFVLAYLESMMSCIEREIEDPRHGSDCRDQLLVMRGALKRSVNASR